MSGFRGTIQGSVQTDYFDHPSRGFPGQIATQGDPQLIDSYPVSDACVIRGGVGVVQDTALTIPAGVYADRPAPFSVMSPIAASVVADFAGIVVRDSAQENDDTGNPIWSPGNMVPVMRQGRIFVLAPVAITAGDAVFMYRQDTTGHGNPIGSFTNAAAGIDTLELTNIRWYDSTVANSIAIIEIGY